MTSPRAAIFGCAGPDLTPDERARFQQDGWVGSYSLLGPQEIDRLCRLRAASIHKFTGPNALAAVSGADEFARWELAEDLTGHHHHLICASCGRVEDVPASAGLERSVAAAAAAITRTTGFRTQRHRVDLVGVCRECG